MCGNGSHTEPSCESRGWWQSKTRRAMCRWATASPQFSSAWLRQLQAIAASEAAAEQAITATISTRARRGREAAGRGIAFSVKVSQLAEFEEAVVNLLPGELGDSLGAKALNGKRAHHAAIEHGVFVSSRRQVGLRSEVAKEAAGKAVAGASRINDFFQRKRRRFECF